MPTKFRRGIVACAAIFICCNRAEAGPPYVADDPQPTDPQHVEMYAFSVGTRNYDGTGGEAGIDFNYGARPDLQLTAVLPVSYERPRNDRTVVGLSNVELAAKYRFLHQADSGWDVSLFPRVMLPSLSHKVGERHAALLLPLWLEKDWGNWSTFGGGGCELNRGSDSKDFCLAAWAVAHQFTPHLQLGTEIVHETADTHGGKASTGFGVGVRYDASPLLHWLAYAGSGLQNANATNRYSWYMAALFTF